MLGKEFGVYFWGCDLKITYLLNSQDHSAAVGNGLDETADWNSLVDQVAAQASTGTIRSSSAALTCTRWFVSESTGMAPVQQQHFPGRPGSVGPTQVSALAPASDRQREVKKRGCPGSDVP